MGCMDGEVNEALPVLGCGALILIASKQASWTE